MPDPQRPAFLDHLLPEPADHDDDKTGFWEARAFGMADAIVRLEENGKEGATLDDCLKAMLDGAGVSLRDVTHPRPAYTVTDYVVDELGCPLCVRIVERGGFVSEVVILRRLANEYPG